MPLYKVTASFTLEADSEDEADQAVFEGLAITLGYGEASVESIVEDAMEELK